MRRRWRGGLGLLSLLVLAQPVAAVTPFLGLEYGVTERENRNWTLLDAFARTIDGQTGSVFNVQAAAFGARCHATADQWTAIDRAIQAARNAGGGTVFFPPCGQNLSYRIAQPIVLDAALYYLTLQGSPSAGASLLQPTTSFTGDALVHIGTTTLNERIAFHGMSFSGRMPGGTDLTVPLLWLQNVAQATVTDSYFLQSNATTGALSITGSSSQVIDVSSNVFGSTTQVGMYVDQTGDLRIVGNHFIEGRVGESNFNGVWGGLKFYFNEKSKSLMARHRQDDPNIWSTDTLFSITNSATSASSSSSTSLPAVSMARRRVPSE